MTEQEFLALPNDQKNVLVAEKVMEWTTSTIYPDMWSTNDPESPTYRKRGWEPFDGQDRWSFGVLEDHLLQTGWSINLVNFGGKVRCRLGHPSQVGVFIATGVSKGAALVIAALRGHGVITAVAA